MQQSFSEKQPKVSVGILTDVDRVRFELNGRFALSDSASMPSGGYWAIASAGQIEIARDSGERIGRSAEIYLQPLGEASFVIRDVVIGINFHWQQKRDQTFDGSLKFIIENNRIIVVNEIGVEDYLTSVISSEMSAQSHPELLKAHAIISRSWLLAQLKPWKQCRGAHPISQKIGELIRWYDQQSHTSFDVCADDHCQRYQGTTKAVSGNAREAVMATFGRILFFDGGICDARFSKSCGGMTESFDAAWGDIQIPYLQVAYDGEIFPAGYSLPLTEESNAEKWIRNSPPAFCNTDDKTILAKILPDFDRRTIDFYRWSVVIEQDELQELLIKKIGVDFGAVSGLEPVQRGGSGRLVRLKIIGEREMLVIGKELEIRRALSSSHLYSSAFMVETNRNASSAPVSFTLTGAGWGHGVGLCQIGAALMAERGYDFERILAHYYRGASLKEFYGSDR